VNENDTEHVASSKPHYTLEYLLEGMTPEHTHREFEFGAEVGHERDWDDAGFSLR